MNKFKNYKYCSILSADENNWICQKSCCPYSTKEGCSLSPMIEGFRRIIYAEIEKEMMEKGEIENE